MALSGTFSNAYRGYTYQISWSAAQNIAGNYSTITCTHKLICASTYSLYINGRTNTCVINGTSKSFTSAAISTSGGGTITLGTTTHTVNHNSNGTGSFSITGTFNMQATISGTYVGSIVTSGSATLNTIARSSTISALTSSVEIDGSNQVTVNISRKNTGFTHTVKFYINSSYTKSFTDVGTSKSYVIPTSWLSAMPSSTSCTAYCEVTTYNGSTKIGSTEKKSFTVTVPGNVKPTVGTITLDPTDISINGTSYNYLVKGKNKLTVSVGTSSAGTGSTIKSYKFSGPSLSTTKTVTTTTASASTNSVASSGTLTYRVTVTDTRGRSNYAEKTITCYDYYSPSFATFKPVRNGTTLTCTYKVSYASINSKNSATVKIYVGGTLKKTISNVKSGTSYTETITLSSADASYSVYATVTDGLGTSVSSATSTAYGASKIININSKGNGVAFGKMAEEENCVDVPRLWSRSNIVAKTNKTGFYVTNAEGKTEPAVYKNSENFWLGATSSSGTHVTGSTCISAGDNTNGVYVSKLVNNVRSEYLILDTNNYTNYVSKKPTQLYSSSSGATGTITLSASADNYSYLEIYYGDNNGKQLNSIRAYSPNGKYVTLACLEPSTSNDEYRVYIRTSGWTISGTSMTPGDSSSGGINTGVYGQFYPDAGGVGTGTDVKVTRNNYIKIYRIFGYT